MCKYPYLDVYNFFHNVIFIDMRDLRNIFIRNLKYFRGKKGMRQLDLSLEINKGANYINSIENSKYFPSPETIQEIADVLGIKPMQLFDENGCLENVIEDNREKLKTEIIENLHNLIKEDIKKEIDRVLG